MEAAHHVEDKNEASRQLDELLHERKKPKWYQGYMLRLNLIIILLIITSATNGYDGSMMNGLQTLGQWRDYFGNPQGSTLGIFNAIQSIGGIAGLPFAPILNDRLGRRATIFIGCCLMLIGTAIQTAATSVGMFIGCRFLIGFGLSFACLAAPILITELAFPSSRAQFTSLYNSTWYLGSIIAAWTTYGTFRINSTWAWRIPSVLQGLPSVLQFFLIFFIPESPRWLMSKGREAQATAVICKHHCGGDMSDPLVEFEVNEIREALKLELEVAGEATYLSLFKTKGNLKRMRIIIAIAFFSQWSGNGIVSYYFNLVLDGIGITTDGQKTLLNGILQVYNLATAYTGALLVERLGRRFLFLVSCGGMLVSYIMWTICAARYAHTGTGFNDNGDPIGGDANAGRGVLAAIFLYYLSYNLAMSPLLVSYTVEILPFRIRSKGLMVMNMCVNASLVFNQYANPIALKALKWKYYIVYVVFLAFEFVYLYLYVIETRGSNGTPLPLEEIAQLFDGDDATQTMKNNTLAAMQGNHENVGYTPGAEKKLEDVQLEDENKVRM